MKNLRLIAAGIALLFLSAAPAFAQTNVLATLSITNVTQLTNASAATLTLRGQTLTWSNYSVSALLLQPRVIAATNTPARALTNLYVKLQSTFGSGNPLNLRYASSTSLVMRAASLGAGLSSGWASLTLNTNQIATTNMAGSLSASNIIAYRLIDAATGEEFEFAGGDGLTQPQVTAALASGTNTFNGAGIISNSLASTTATNSIIGSPLAFTQGTNAVVSFAAQATLLTHGSTFGRYGIQFSNALPIRITRVARWIGAANSNVHPVEVTDAGGRVLAMAPIDTTRYATNGWGWAPLDNPPVIPAGSRFNVVAHETTDWFYQSSLPTMASSTVARIGAVADNTFPHSFHSWTNLGYRVNFEYYTVATDQAAEGYLDVTARNVAASLAESYAGSAAIDTSVVQTDDWKVPQLGIAMYVHDFDNNRLPNESNVWAFANAMRTNGMLAAGWNQINPDDMWFLAVHSTNTALVLTQMNQFYWSGSAGGASGENVVSLLIPRDANGLMYENTNTFPSGISNTAWRVRTNRAGNFQAHMGHYLNTRTNMTQFSNEVFRATRWGLPTLFVDTTVNEPHYGTNLIEATTRRIIRTFQDATLRAAEAGNAGMHTNATHGMLLYAAGVANISPDVNIVENQWLPGDAINGINGYLLHGGDISTLSNVVLKSDVLMTWRRWYRPGHPAHFQFAKYDSQQTAEFYRRKAAIVLLLPAHLNTGPDAAFLGGDQMWVLTNQYPWTSILKDKAVLPGRWTYTNGLARIGVRQLRAKDSGTNYIVLLNLAATNYNLTLNVTNFGGVSNVTYTATDVWDYGTGTRTNFTFVDETTRTISPTNAVGFEVTPAAISSSTFNANQFAHGGAGGTNLKSGVTITNAMSVTREGTTNELWMPFISSEFQFLALSGRQPWMYFGVTAGGTPYLTFPNGITASDFIGGASQLTGITGSQIGPSGGVTNGQTAVNFGALTVGGSPPTITLSGGVGGFASGVFVTNLTASRVVVTDADKGLASSVAVTDFMQTNEINRVFVMTNSAIAGPNFSVFRPGGIALTNAATFNVITNGGMTNSGNIQTGTFNSTGAAAFGAGITVGGATSTFSTGLTVGQRLFWTGNLGTAVGLTGNTNDFDIGTSGRSIFRINCTATSDITGIVGFDNYYILIVNVGSAVFTFKNADGGSSAANQFALVADYAVSPNEAVTLWYDPTSDRWRVVGAQ